MNETIPLVPVSISSRLHSAMIILLTMLNVEVELFSFSLFFGLFTPSFILHHGT